MNRAWSALFFIALMLTQHSSIFANEVILANGEWPPYQSKHLKHSGFVSHIVTKAFSSVGVKVKFVYLPWKRGMEKTRTGLLDGSFIWRMNDERDEQFYLSDPLIELGTAVFYKKGKVIKWKTADDFKNYRIGGVIGYEYGTADLESQGVLSINRIASDKANYKKLLSNRIDVFFEDAEVGLQRLSELDLNHKIVMDPRFVTKASYVVLFSKAKPESKKTRDLFNQGLKQLRANQDYQDIIDAARRGEYR